MNIHSTKDQFTITTWNLEPVVDKYVKELNKSGSRLIEIYLVRTWNLVPFLGVGGCQPYRPGGHFYMTHPGVAIVHTSYLATKKAPGSLRRPPWFHVLWP